MFNISDFKVGQRIAVHPATDLFMRGVRFATVTKVGRKVLHLTCDRTSLRFRLSPTNVTEIL